MLEVVQRYARSPCPGSANSGCAGLLGGQGMRRRTLPCAITGGGPPHRRVRPQAGRLSPAMVAVQVTEARLVRSPRSAALFVTAVALALLIVFLLPPRSGGAEITQVAAGNSSTCALDAGGIVYCWGARMGAEADRARGDVKDDLTPARVRGLAGVTAISVGSGSACAVLKRGFVYCWGSNASGELGAGRATESRKPVRVAGIRDAQSVSVGESVACIVRRGGQVACWGDNAYGQLGNGSKAASSVPVAVIGITGAVDVVAGRISCAALGSAGVSCWGYRSRPAADEALADSAIPILQPGFGAASRVAAGYHERRICALSAGVLSCGGRNPGDGTMRADTPVPVQLGDEGRVISAAASEDNACAVSEVGGVWCWGRNDFGELGTGAVSPPNPTDTFVGPWAAGSRPQRVLLISARQVSLSPGGWGTATACAADVSGRVFCWGWNGFGQVGDGSTSKTANAVPLPVEAIFPSRLAVSYTRSDALVASTGRLPTTARSVRQEATLLSGATPRTVSGTCPLVPGRATRRFACSLRLPRGDWSISTEAVSMTEHVIADATRTLRVR